MNSQNNNSLLSGDSHYEPLPEESDEFYDITYKNAFFNKLEDNSVPLSDIDDDLENKMIKKCEDNIAIAKELDKCNRELIKINSKSNAAKVLDKKRSAADKLAINEKRRQTRARAFQLTLNEVDKYDALKEYISNIPSLRYMISCQEIAPSTGHAHIHLYCQFNSPYSLSIKKCQGAHIEKCFGTPEQNKAYIEKDGHILDEIGELGTNKDTKFPTIAEVKMMTDEEMEKCPLQYYNQIRKIKDERNNNMKVEDLGKVVQVYYLWGRSGCGKTSYAKLAIKKLGKPFNQVKFENTFWSGLNEDCEVALYDDWRDSDMKPNEFIKFIDYNRHMMNVKYGQVRNNYKYIFITSIQDPQKIYWESSKKNEEQVRQWVRRMKIINIEEEYGVEEIREKYIKEFGDEKQLDFDINNII